MKKIIAIIMMVLLLINIMPIVLADEVTGSLQADSLAIKLDNEGMGLYKKSSVTGHYILSGSSEQNYGLKGYNFKFGGVTDLYNVAGTELIFSQKPIILIEPTGLAVSLWENGLIYRKNPGTERYNLRSEGNNQEIDLGNYKVKIDVKDLYNSDDTERLVSSQTVLVVEQKTPRPVLISNEATKTRKEFQKEIKQKIEERKENIKHLKDLKLDERKLVKDKLQEKKYIFEESKKELQKTRLEFKQCNNKKSEECQNLRKLVKKDLKSYLLSLTEKLSTSLDKTKLRVKDSKLDETKKESIYLRIEKDQETINLVKTKIDLLSETSEKDNINVVSKELKEVWSNIQTTLKFVNSVLVEKRIGNIVERADNLELRLDKIIAKLKEQGADVSQIQLKIDEFNKHVEIARQKRDESIKLFAEAKIIDHPGAEIKEKIKMAHEILKEAHQELKKAHEILKEIVKLIKEQKNGNKVLEETKDSVSETQVDVDTQTNTNTDVNLVSV